MAIEPGLYAAPEGLSEDDSVTLEVELPEAAVEVVMTVDGGAEIDFSEPVSIDDPDMAPFDANLAEYLDEDVLQSLSSELLEDIDSDVQSRQEWAESFVKGLEVLGMKYEERTAPWEGACGAFSTVLSEAAIRFQAECMGEIFPAGGPVMSKILGEETRKSSMLPNALRRI